jgi:methanogenic corrinoid protein MtbC1
MVVTGVAGELHQIGANLVADAMESKGWNVRFFGSNAPYHDVMRAILDSAASVLCVSTTLVANLPATAQLIRSVRQQTSERKLRIVLGGAAYRHCSDLDAVLDGPVEVMDLRSALAALCS